jgi:hypothetical protein
MKLLTTTILICTLLFACQKENTPTAQPKEIPKVYSMLSGKELRGVAQTHFRHAFNTQVSDAVSFTVKIPRFGGGEQKSFWGGATTGIWWIQFGGFSWDGTSYIAMCFNNTNGYQGFPAGTRSLAPRPELVPGTVVEFKLRNVGTNTIISVGGTDISEVPTGGLPFTSSVIAIEGAYSNKEPNIKPIQFYPALRFSIGGVWQDAAYLWTTGNAYGIKGINQDANLRYNEVFMGSGLQRVENFTYLY